MTQAYEVRDVQTDQVVYRTNSSVDATREADRRDEAYGAVRYQVVRDYDVMSDEEYEAMMVRVRAEKVAA